MRLPDWPRGRPMETYEKVIGLLMITACAVAIPAAILAVISTL